MNNKKSKLNSLYNSFFLWAAKNGVLLIRISLGIIFFWFGVQKFFPGVSSAEDIATRTIEAMTFGIISGSLAMVLLAIWECVIGLWFFWGKQLKAFLIVFILQMIGTFFPLFIFPTETFSLIPFVPTLEGQYIIKNLSLITGAFIFIAYQLGYNIKK